MTMLRRDKAAEMIVSIDHNQITWSLIRPLKHAGDGIAGSIVAKGAIPTRLACWSPQTNTSTVGMKLELRNTARSAAHKTN